MPELMRAVVELPWMSGLRGGNLNVALEHFICRYGVGLSHLWVFSAMKTPLHTHSGLPSNRKNALRHKLMLGVTGAMLGVFLQGCSANRQPSQGETSLANAAGLPAEQEKNDPIAKVLGTTMARRFSDVADHARHAAEGTGSLRDMLNSAYETNLSLADVHLNMIMKKLSAWAAIIAVPTLITGFMGMNVPYPGYSETGGFIAALVVMIAAVCTLFILFKRSDWL